MNLHFVLPPQTPDLWSTLYRCSGRRTTVPHTRDAACPMVEEQVGGAGGRSRWEVGGAGGSWEVQEGGGRCRWEEHVQVGAGRREGQEGEGAGWFSQAIRTSGSNSLSGGLAAPHGDIPANTIHSSKIYWGGNTSKYQIIPSIVHPLYLTFSGQ